MTASDVARAVRHRRWLFAVVLLLVTGAGAAAALLPADRYRASATLLATPTARASQANTLSAAQFVLPSLAKVVESGTVRSRVLSESPVLRRARDLEVDASAEPGTGVLRVQATSTNRTVVAPMADALAAELLRLQTPDDLFAVQVLDPATVPTSPAEPQRASILVGSLILALILALLAAVVADSLSPVVSGAQGFEQRFGLPVLAVLPAARGGRLTDLLDNGSLDRVERLRITLAPHLGDTGARTVAVAAVSRATSTSRVAAQVAAAAASPTTQVCLVDADAGDRSLAELVGDGTKPGLAQVVAGRSSLDEALLPVPAHRFAYLSPGLLSDDEADAAHPPAALAHALPRLVSRMVSRGSTVVVRSPALDGSSEALAVAATVDTVILVVAVGMREAIVQAGLDELRAVQGKVMGAVLT
jgi:Mrp family chromosome partitioning ATPase